MPRGRVYVSYWKVVTGKTGKEAGRWRSYTTVT
jgi:hypothetical protein